LIFKVKIFYNKIFCLTLHRYLTVKIKQRKNKMKIILVGATGFIGKAMVNKLLENKHEVVVLARNTRSAEKQLPASAKISVWNPELEVLSKQLNIADVLINLAGEPIADKRWTAERKKSISESRIGLTGTLVEALKKCSNPPKLFIQASAIGVYNSKSNALYTETSEIKPTNFVTNLVHETEVTAMKAQAIVERVAIMRIGLVLGKNGGVLQSFLPSFRNFAGTWLGSGKQAFPWIHLNDICRIAIHIIENEGSKGVYNAVAPGNLNAKEFSKALAKVMKRPVWFGVPGFLLKLVFGELAQEVLLTDIKPLPEALLKENFKFQFTEIEAALNDILKTDKN